jgi:hypothetical protein
MLKIAQTLWAIAVLFAMATVIHYLGPASVKQFTQAHEVEGTFLWIAIVLAAVACGEIAVYNKPSTKGPETAKIQGQMEDL